MGGAECEHRAELAKTRTRWSIFRLGGIGSDSLAMQIVIHLEGG